MCVHLCVHVCVSVCVRVCTSLSLSLSLFLSLALCVSALRGFLSHSITRAQCCTLTCVHTNTQTQGSKQEQGVVIVGGSKLNDMGAVISALSDGGLSVVRARTALFDAPLISTVSQQPGKARSACCFMCVCV